MTDELSRILTDLVLRDAQARQGGASRDLVAVMAASMAGWHDVADEILIEVAADRARSVAVLLSAIKFGIECLGALAQASDEDPATILQRAAANLPE